MSTTDGGISDASLIEIARRVSSLPDQLVRHLPDPRTPIRRGSRLHRETSLSDKRTSELLKSAHDQAMRTVIIAAEALGTFETIGLDRRLKYTPWVISRQVIETSGTVAWLVDPAIEPSLRARRYLGIVRANLREYDRYVGRVSSAFTTTSELTDVATQQAQERIGLAADEGHLGPAIPFQLTAAVGVLGYLEDYSFASGAAHGYEWAIGVLRRNHYQDKSAETNSIFGRLVFPAIAFTKAVWMYAVYALPTPTRLAVENDLNALFDDLDFADEARFWQQAT